MLYEGIEGEKEEEARGGKEEWRGKSVLCEWLLIKLSKISHDWDDKTKPIICTIKLNNTIKQWKWINNKIIFVFKRI